MPPCLEHQVVKSGIADAVNAAKVYDFHTKLNLLQDAE